MIHVTAIPFATSVPKKAFIYHRHQSRKRVVTVRCKNQVYAPYFERYSDTVCGNIPERIREKCMRGMVLPDFEHQQSIIQEIDKIKSIMPLESSAEGAIMLLMRDESNETTLWELLNSLSIYYDTLNDVRELVTDTFNHML